jgi:hypothetical protein
MRINEMLRTLAAWMMSKLTATQPEPILVRTQHHACEKLKAA